MSSAILFQQLLVLLALMITGFIAYKTNLLDDHTYGKLSSFMVWILNPFLMISGVIGKDGAVSFTLVWQNIVMVFALYGMLFIIGFVYIGILRYKGRDSYLYRMELLFPNVGFMGVPLVKEMFGSEYIVLVAFYMLAFNVLVYTYGVHLSSQMGGQKVAFNLKKLINPGTITAIMAILIFALKLNVPTPIATYVDYLGNTAIALSMIIIGMSLAKVDWKSGFNNKNYYIFLLADMIIIPVIMVLLSKLVPFDKNVVGVFQILACMPVASMTCMFAQEYGKDGSECAKLIAMTTVITVITAPLVILICG